MSKANPKHTRTVGAVNKRREQQLAELRAATATLGEDVMMAIIEAVRQDFDRPLAGLPDKWRDKAIAAFRQMKK